MEWEQHRFGPGVTVTFTPRPEYNGRAVLPELLAQAGCALHVRALWLMDDADPYPGEWALCSADGTRDVLGRAWISSGDVTGPTNSMLSGTSAG